VLFSTQASINRVPFHLKYDTVGMSCLEQYLRTVGQPGERTNNLCFWIGSQLHCSSRRLCTIKDTQSIDPTKGSTFELSVDGILYGIIDFTDVLLTIHGLINGILQLCQEVETTRSGFEKQARKLLVTADNKVVWDDSKSNKRPKTTPGLCHENVVTCLNSATVLAGRLHGAIEASCDPIRMLRVLCTIICQRGLDEDKKFRTIVDGIQNPLFDGAVEGAEINELVDLWAIEQTDLLNAAHRMLKQMLNTLEGVQVTFTAPEQPAIQVNMLISDGMDRGQVEQTEYLHQMIFAAFFYSSQDRSDKARAVKDAVSSSSSSSSDSSSNSSNSDYSDL
jgi:hypothetical protein